MWPLGFRLAPQDSAVSKHLGGLASWSAQTDSPGTALTVCGWPTPGGQNKWGERGLFLHNPFSKEKCLQQALTGKYLVLTVCPWQLNQAFADNNYYDNCRAQGEALQPFYSTEFINSACKTKSCWCRATGLKTVVARRFKQASFINCLP